MMIIDSHQHFWRYNQEKDNWINESMSILKKDFMPMDLKPILSENVIKGCIAVQADQSEEETEFLINLADRNDFVRGIVGWVDLKNPQIEERLQYFSQFKKLKGFRHIVQSEANNFMLRDDFQNGIQKLGKYNFTFDILIFPSQLPALIELAKHFPEQNFVLDHLGKPDIKYGESQFWKKHIKMLANSKNVFCKLSGLVTEAKWYGWKKKEFQPYLDVAFDVFGPERLMFGSDWPVCLLSSNYCDVLDIVQSHFEKFPISEREKIMGKNALGFYNIDY